MYIFGPEFPKREQEAKPGSDNSFPYEVFSLTNFDVSARVTDNNNVTQRIGPKPVKVDR